MTKEPQPTTHNAERGARCTCREGSETVSSPKRIEKKLGCSLIGEISLMVYNELFGGFGEKRVARHVGDLEETCLEKNYSAFLAKMCQHFGEIVRRFFGENRSEILEIWRTLFGEIVVGDLEKSFGDFGENRSATLEIVMVYRNAR